MTFRSALIISAILLVSGCQPGLRVYDGVVGYEIAKSDSGVTITYTEDAQRGWVFLENQTRKVCALMLSAPIEAVQTRTLSKEVVSKEINVSVFTAGQADGARGKANTPGGTMGGSVNIPVGSTVEGVGMDMKFNRLISACSKSVAP